MSDRYIAYSRARYPTPNAGRVGFSLLFLGMWIAPVAWAGNLMATFALSVHACYPGGAPLARVSPGFGFVWPLMLAFYVVSILLCVSGFLVSYRNWRLSGRDWLPDGDDVVPVEEGSTRYLSVIGMAFSVLFFSVTVLGAATFAIVPLCER